MTRRSVAAGLVLGAVALYLAVFFATEVPSLTQTTGKTFVRAEFFRLLLVPEDLAACWLGTPPEFSLADRLPVLLVAGFMLAWAVALGWLGLRLIRADRAMPPLERLVFSSAVGRNAVSTLVLAAGWAGGLRMPAAFVVSAVATWALAGCLIWRAHGKKALGDLLAARRRASGNFQPRPRAKPRLTSPDSSAQVRTSTHPAGLSHGWLGLAIPFTAVILLGGMLPPIEFDVREYHLQAPKEFYQQGRIGFLPHNVYANMPLGAEMFSLLGMVITGDWWLGALAGKTVIASYAILTGLGLYAAGRRLFGQTAGIVAAVAYISIPWIIQVSTLGLVDAALGCYLFVAWYAAYLGMAGGAANGVVARSADRGTGLTEEFPPPGPTEGLPKQDGDLRSGWSAGSETRAEHVAGSEARAEYEKTRTEHEFPSHAILAGYLAGSAAACKYPGVLYVVLPVGAWIVWASCRSLRRGAWRPIGGFLFAAVLGCGLWFAKNGLLTGNPTYPLGYGLFGGTTWTAEKDQQWNRVHRPHDFSLHSLAHDAARVVLTSDWLSPILVPLAALAFAVPARRRLVVGLAVYFGLVIAAWWLLTHRIDRFWLPAMPLLALLAGAGASWNAGRLWRGALAGLLVLGTVANLLVVTSAGGGYNRYFVPFARLRDEPERVDAWHRYLNRHARGGKVLLVGDAQPFDLEIPAVYNTCFDDSIFEQLVRGRSPEQVRAEFCQHGITHVLVHWGEIARYRATYGFTEFVTPEVFVRLVESGVLSPLPPIPQHSGQAYRVVCGHHEPAPGAP